MAPMQFFIVNAFSSKPFHGNPATVVIVPRELVKEGDDVMAPFFQKLSAEVGQVETAFVIPPDQPKTDFKLRFFTKSKEMPFCGHATLAVAHVLATEFNFPSDLIYFSTSTGVVVVKCSNKKLFQLDLSPSLPVPLTTPLQLQAMADALGLKSKDDIVDAVLHESSHNLILVLRSAARVVAAKPVVDKLVAAVPAGVSKVTITAVPIVAPVTAGSIGLSPSVGGAVSSNDEDMWRKYDFITRLFAPWIGIAEDAVSGASHAILAQYWRTRSPVIREKSNLLCYQPSPRGGEILLQITGGRVGVSGEAITIAKGLVSLHSQL